MAKHTVHTIVLVDEETATLGHDGSGELSLLPASLEAGGTETRLGGFVTLHVGGADGTDRFELLLDPESAAELASTLLGLAQACLGAR